MFRGQRHRVRILFGTADVVLIALAFALAYAIRSRLNLENDFYIPRSVAAALLIWSMVVWVATGAWWETYDRIDATHPRIILRHAFRQCLLGAMSVILFEFAGRLDLSRLFVALFAVCTWVLLCLFRLNAGLLLRVVRREFSVPFYVMVVGLGDAALRLGRQLEEAGVSHGVRLRGFFADSPEGASTPIQLEQSYPVHPITELPHLLRSHVIDEIIFATDSRRLADLEDVLLLCEEEGVRTRIAVGFLPHVNSRVYLDRLGTSPLLTFSSTPHDEIRLLVKRVTDIVLAGAALVLLFPIMLLIVMLIRLTSPGPAIFRQERCGLNGRRFVFYKFRSMCLDAEAMREAVEHMSQRELAMKIPNDPRLTGVGRWLRKFSADELPQLWNVLKGDMSLVGPRPAIPSEVEQYKRWQRRRLRMRPGLTCLWAISGRDEVDFETWMKLDMEYIDNWSLGLDWKIILRTIPSVLSGRGAH
ncbi:MAG TPA: sugar transferase [Bryobacteraceae bacterium]|nr:sugar transferase [Bryobacteraceae bacterium]